MENYGNAVLSRVRIVYALGIYRPVLLKYDITFMRDMLNVVRSLSFYLSVHGELP